MLTLGLTGGVASGKSLAAMFFSELGATVLDADCAGHGVLCEPAVHAAIAERWGPEILTPAGEVDRTAVARRVFGDSPQATANRQFLQDLLHPRIRARMEAELARLAGLGNKFFVLDAPLLLEAGWESACDRLVFVDAPREFRLARGMDRGWTADQFAQREAAQWPVERKRERCDWVLPNSDTPQDLREQVRTLWLEQVNPLLSSAAL